MNKSTFYRLINVEVQGIKNLKNITKINFLNSTLDNSKKINLKNKKIKAIYGANGSGKSAIMTSLDLYKNVATISNYLEKPEVIKELKEITNKKSKTIYLSCTFAVETNGIVEHIFKHTIEIFKGDIVPYELKESFASAKDIHKANGEYKPIYEVQNGNVNLFSFSDKYINMFKNMEKLKLINSTITSNFNALINILIELLPKNKKDIVDDDDLNFMSCVTFILLIPRDLDVYLDIKDKHAYKDPYFDVKNKLKEKNIDESLISEIIPSGEKYYYTSFEDVIQKQYLQKYKDNYKRIKEFINIIKPSLQDIKIITTDLDKKKYKCSKKFIYEDGEVNFEYESTGIKKMVELYSYIKQAFDGSIVFIDEIDANISGIFLDKLMECFNKYGKGQLCFTSHNYYSMNKLKKFIELTTIGENGLIYDISKNGNSNPANTFYSGQIPDSPFNIESYDFVKMFVDEV